MVQMGVPLQSEVLQLVQLWLVLQEAWWVDEGPARQRRRAGPEPESARRLRSEAATKAWRPVARAALSQRPAAEALTDPSAGELARVSSDKVAVLVA